MNNRAPREDLLKGDLPPSPAATDLEQDEEAPLVAGDDEMVLDSRPEGGIVPDIPDDDLSDLPVGDA